MINCITNVNFRNYKTRRQLFGDAQVQLNDGAIEIVLLGGIALVVQAIPPIPAHFSIAWSVCLSVCLSVTFVYPA